MTHLNSPLPFPAALPPGFQYKAESVQFDPQRHLQLEAPESIVTLDDLGYTEAQIKKCPTDFGISSTARLLSDEGIAAMLEVARSLKENAVHCERIENMVRGGVYQSKFLRDFCLSPEVTEFLTDIFGTPIAPHTMPLHLGHLNFAPNDLNRSVDKWHSDTLGLDYVLMLTDPSEICGGKFEYFNGTRDEAAAYAASDQSIPDSRTVAPAFPGAGYAVILQGNMVVHRASKLTAHAERITLVNGYVPLNCEIEDACRFPDLTLVDPHHVLFAEYARHKAWLSAGKLHQLIAEMPFTDDRHVITGQLRDAIADVEAAIAEISAENSGAMIHYGD